MKQNKKEQGAYKIAKAQIDLLDNTDGWTWEEPDAFSEQYNNWVEQYNKLGRKPFEKSNDENEGKAGQWQSTIRRIKKGLVVGRILTIEQLDLLNSIEGWTWEANDAFAEQYNNWIEEYQRLGKKPSSKSKYNNERKAGSWQTKMRLVKSGKEAGYKLTAEQLQILENTNGWTWKDQDAFTQQYNNWVKQYQTLGKRPTSSSMNTIERKASKWRYDMRQARKGKGTNKLTIEQIEILNNTIGWTW